VVAELPIWGPPNELARVIAEASRDSRFAPHQCEMMMWQLDTLDCLGRFPPDEFELYLKGGTCVQHYLPRQKQRFSMDLDFSACFRKSVETSERLPTVRRYLQTLNDQLWRDGWTTSHGMLRIPEIRPGFNPMCLSARLFEPVKCPKTNSMILGIRNAAFIKMEFFLYDNDPEYSEQKLSLASTDNAVREIVFNVASKTRLLADKIIALSGEGYGARDESKDILDLKSLSELYGLDVPGAKRMISSWASFHRDADGKPQPLEPPVKIVHAARKTVLRRSDMSAEALAQMMGLLYARGREGFNLKTSDWKRVCIDVAGFLKSSLLPLFT